MTLRHVGLGPSHLGYRSLTAAAASAQGAAAAVSGSYCSAKVDPLFVVDNSNSISGEQAALRAQIPKLIEALTTGPRVQEEPDPSTNPGSGTGTLRPSCVSAVAGESAVSTAFPSRRLVALARAFGKQSAKTTSSQPSQPS